jgi:ceramide glucosyltransferase
MVHVNGSFDLGDPVQLLFLLGLVVSLAFYLASYYGAWSFFRRRRVGDVYADDDSTLPPVTVLKPLKGLDAELYENLSTYCRQDYPRFQMVLGVADADDPAVEVVRRLRADYPDVRIDLVIDGRVYGTNYKISNLHNMYRAAAHDVIVIADSDIRMRADHLRRVVAPLADRQVGAVTCLYRAVNTGGFPTLVESLFVNTDFAPSVLVARLVEEASYTFGATIALRRPVLDAIGGFLPLASYLADDYHLGQRLAERGYRLVLSDVVVETVLAVGSWKRLVEHQVRWARTYRNCRPGGYFGSVLTHGALWATLNMLYNHFSPIACLVAATIYGVRVVIASRIANRYLHAPLRARDALLVPFKDLFISAVWVLAFLGDTVRWSGRSFRVLKHGHMVPIPGPALDKGALSPYAARKERDRRPASI